MWELLSGVTLEKKPYLCSCKSSDLVDAIEMLNKVADDDLQHILAPYHDSQTTVVVHSDKTDSVVAYLNATNDVESVFIDYNVVKAFTEDSLVTYLAMKRDGYFELYRSQSAPVYMW